MNFLRKLLVVSLVFLLSAGHALAAISKVSVAQIIDNDDLNAVRSGLLDGLEAKGYEPGKNLEFTYALADGKPAKAAKIARKLASDNPHVLVGIATPTAQALVSATRSIPIVFTAVT